MSKSLGNVIGDSLIQIFKCSNIDAIVDPVDIMDGISLDALHTKLLEGNLDPKEVKNATIYQNKSFPNGIGQCGSDALRFSLIAYTTGGQSSSNNLFFSSLMY